jgi:hypothetical protein
LSNVILFGAARFGVQDNMFRQQKIHIFHFKYIGHTFTTKECAGKQAEIVTSTKYIILGGEHIGHDHIGHAKIGADNMHVGERSTGDFTVGFTLCTHSSCVTLNIKGDLKQKSIGEYLHGELVHSGTVVQGGFYH